MEGDDANTTGTSQGYLTQAIDYNQIVPNFLSKHVRTWLDSKKEAKSLKPGAEECFAAVVMADVSGYSKLTAVLAEKGSLGAELLSKVMKGYLDKVRCDCSRLRAQAIGVFFPNHTDLW